VEVKQSKGHFQREKLYNEAMNAVATEVDRRALIRRGLNLEYVSIAYNCLESLVAIIAGLLSGSIALVGFGIDSVVEVTSSVALLWRLHSDGDHRKREWKERISLRIVGFCFVGLALYITAESLLHLWRKDIPEESIPGIVLAVLSLGVMPLLASAKRKVARGISSGALMADAKQTEFCTYLSAILLAGLLLNALFDWWWADPLAALVMVPIIAKEGVSALQGRHCGCGPCST
jgi:divalent metal cation (Fe/Co/Zn/Cd) transporter